jgi:hypothetical protein
MQDRQDTLTHSSNKLFETRFFEKLLKTTFENSPLIHIKFVKKRDTAVLTVECFGFLAKPELAEKSKAMVKRLVELFYQEFYPRSEFWQKANEKWMRKTRKWGRDFGECIKEYLEGRATGLWIPPVEHKNCGTRVFLCVGNITILKMESQLVAKFLEKALCVIEHHVGGRNECS